MAEGERGRDSFEVAKEFIARIGERAPTTGELQEVSPALRDIYERLMRVRAWAPSVDLSEKLWVLMGMAGFPVKPARDASAVRRAASFL